MTHRRREEGILAAAILVRFLLEKEKEKKKKLVVLTLCLCQERIKTEK